MIDAKPNTGSKMIGCENPGSLFRQTSTLSRYSPKLRPPMFTHQYRRLFELGLTEAVFVYLPAMPP